MTPLHTHLEYTAAKSVHAQMCHKFRMNILSFNDAIELLKLKDRITAYESEPTVPNKIQHTKGNVFNNEK